MKSVNVYVSAFATLASAYRDPSDLDVSEVKHFMRAVQEPLKLFGVTMWSPDGTELIVRCDGHEQPTRIETATHARWCMALGELGKLVLNRAGTEQLSLQATV